MELRQEDRYPAALLGAFAVIWALLAIAPSYRQDWLLENVLVFVALPIFVITYRSLRFSNFAYSCFFVFLVFHEIGAHYTYSEVPWDEWLATVTGQSFNAALGIERNHYDRVIHFLYGLLVFPMAWELFEHRARPQRLWRWLMPLLFVLSHSTIYELVEWAAAAVFGGELGQAYLGTQGDVWDAQKDMALAALGAVLGLAVALLRGARRNPPSPSTG